MVHLLRGGAPGAALITGMRTEHTTVQPRRLLVAGDWHRDISWARSCCDVAGQSGCDGVLQLGDIGAGDWGTSGAGDAFVEALEGHVSEAGLGALYFIGGNHEDWAWLARRQQAAGGAGIVALSEHVAWLANGARWTWRGVRLGALGGAFSIDWPSREAGRSWWPGDGPDGEEPSRADLDAIGYERLDVLVTHEAPVNPVLAGRAARIEDEERCRWTREMISEAIRRTKPALVLHGHWHERLSYSVRSGDDDCWADVEALASNLEGDERSYGVLDLDPLRWVG